MKILFISPIRKGGPYSVLKNLSSLNKNYIFEASISGFIKGFFSKKYDIVHTVLPVFFNIFNKKIILHLHGIYYKERSIKNPLGYLYPLAILFSKKIVVPTLFLKKNLNLKNAVVIPNPIPIFDFHKKNYSIKEEVNLCIMTKFHFYDKASGVLDLVEILEKLNSNKTINLNILGSGKYLDEISKIVLSKNIKNIKINFLGFIENPYFFLSKQDIFAYYSNLDTFGVALGEAMSLGLPVISNEFGAASEIISEGETGFICNSKEEYLINLKLLLNSENLRSKLGKKAILHIKKNFSLKKISRKFQDLYEF